MADEDNTNNTDTAAGHISPGHGAHDGERSRSPTRSPTRSPEGSPGRFEKSDDSEVDNRKRKRSPSPKDEKVDSVGEKFDLFVPTRKKERHMWALPVQLADYFNDLTREFFEDDDLRDGDGNPIKEVHPVPENIQKVPRLDNFIEQMWQKDSKKFLTENDHDVARIQERIRDVMGPLSKVWLTLEEVKKDVNYQVNIEEMAELTQQSVLLLAQASNSATYKRRVDAMKNVHGSRQAATGAIKKHSEILMKSGDHLFGQEFKKFNKSTVKETKVAGELLGKPSSSSSGKKFTKNREREERDQPFRNTPSSNGASRFNRGGRGGRITFKTQKPNYGKGKYPRGRTLVQFACTTESRVLSRESSSLSKKSTRKNSSTGKLTFCRKDKTFPAKLASPYKGQIHSESCQGLGDTTLDNPKSKEIAKPYSVELTGDSSNRLRGTEHVGKGGYQRGHPKGIPNAEQHVCETKEYWGVSPNNKPERAESIHTLPSLQNGGLEGPQTAAQQGGLPLQVRSEGRLLLSTPGNPISKMGEVQLEREIVRVSLPSFWTGTRPKNIHQNYESTCVDVETIRNQTNHLPGRPVNNGILERGADSSQRYHNFPFSPSGVDNQSREIRIQSNKIDRISGGDGKQPRHDTVLANGKGSKTERSMSENIDFITSNPARSLLPDREAKGNSSSYTGSTLTAEIPSESPEIGTTTNLELWNNGHFGQGLCHGIKMVEGKSRPLQGETPSDRPSRSDNSIGCSQNRGLGSFLWAHSNRGDLECGGSSLGHKHSGTAGSRTGNQDFHKVFENKIDTHSDRQHCSPVLSSKNGGNRKHAYECNNKKDLEVFSGQKYQLNSRMDPNSHECIGRLGVEALSGLKRMETLSEYIPKNLPKTGIPRLRPVRISKLPPTTQVCELETRPSLPVCRRIQQRVAPIQTLCIPTILSNNKDPQENSKGQSAPCDSNYPFVDSPAMVPMPAGNVNSGSHTLAKIPKTAEKSKAGKPSTNSRVKLDSSGMEHIRSALKARGISEESSEIISNSRAKGTTTTYGYAWNKWVGWCQQRKTDPSDSTLGEILDFLTFFFHQKKAKHRYLGVFRSALSAYHTPIEGCKVGKHPLVSSFMAGVKNLRPPMPKYTNIWDVDDVLRYIKNLPRPLSLKQLSYKTAMLLALIIIPRGAEISILDINYMGLTKTKCVFSLKELPKNQKRAMKTPELDFDNFQEEPNLCPIKSLLEYCEVTRPSRVINRETSLFLSLHKPHRAISKSSTARWIKDVLKGAGIDTQIYQAHSVRAAATSKAFMKGLSVSDIIKRGNWSQESTWQRFYNKDIKSVSSTFQEKVLRGFEDGEIACSRD